MAAVLQPLITRFVRPTRRKLWLFIVGDYEHFIGSALAGALLTIGVQCLHWQENICPSEEGIETQFLRWEPWPQRKEYPWRRKMIGGMPVINDTHFDSDKEVVQNY